MDTPTWGFWAEQFLLQIGAPVEREKVVFMLAWMRKENTKAKWNPQATTQPWDNATSFNSFNVRNYKTFADGQGATVKTIQNGRYPVLLAKLREPGVPAEVLATELAHSPWGTGTVNIVGARQNYDTAIHKVLGTVYV